MRSVFFNLLHQEMKVNNRLFLLIADMGLGLVDPIQKDFPDRYLNVGIAEQNMIGISAGLCNLGYRPVCYTISNFLVHRCFEQVRNDICLHNYPVTLVGTSTGFDNGQLGPTHHVVDDIGCLKVLPGMNIYSPTSSAAARMVFKDIMGNSFPAYVRIGKGMLNVEAAGGGVNHMALSRPSAGNLVITHGNLLESCLKAAEKKNDFSVYAMNKIYPLDKNEINGLFAGYENIVVVEDHFAGSGLYNTLCQYKNESKESKARLFVIAPPAHYEDRIGDKNYFAFKYGLNPEQIADWSPA